MAEYIDREKLIERLHNAEENYKADHDYEIDNDPFSDGILSAMFSVNQIVGSEPTANVVERDKVNKAIEEIEQTLYVDSLIFGELIDFKDGKISADDVIEEFNRVTRKEVLEILKRNIEE